MREETSNVFGSFWMFFFHRRSENSWTEPRFAIALNRIFAFPIVNHPGTFFNRHSLLFESILYHHIRAQHPMLLIILLRSSSFHAVHSRPDSHSMLTFRPRISHIVQWCGFGITAGWDGIYVLNSRTHTHTRLARNGSTAFSPYEFHERRRRLVLNMKT